METNIIKTLKKYAKKYERYILISIDEASSYYIGWIGNPVNDEQDLPILIYDKATNKIKEERIPPIDNEELKEIWTFNEDEQYLKENKRKLDKITKNLIDVETNNSKQEEGEKDMADSKKIRALLKKYGASDYEIENFMDELEEDNFNPYSKDVISKLRETPEGKAIIRDMPKTDKQELIKKIKEHLGKND